MKKMLIIVVMLLLACEPEDSLNRIRLQTEIELGIGESTEVIDITNNKKFTLAVDNITDSRCPSDATCIWAGNVLVEISIENLLDTLCLNDCIGVMNETHSRPFRYDGIDYEIILHEVNPYPTSTNDRPKVARLSVITRNDD